MPRKSPIRPSPPAGDTLARYLAAGAPGRAKYARLRAALSRAIDDGLWKEETALPTELDLTRLSGLSLGTVQRAVRALVEEGRLVRIRGRGTYVAERARGIAAPFLHVRFLDDGGEQLLPVYPKVLSRRLIREQGPWSEMLKQGGADVLRIERALSVNREFTVFSSFYINARQFPGFAAKSVEELTNGNYKLMLSREFNLPPIVYRQVLELVPLTGRPAAVTTVAEGTIGMLFRVRAHTGATTPVYYHELYVPPNRRRLQLADMVLPTGR